MKQTQKRAILQYMREQAELDSYWPITPMTALNLCGCFRLSERVREIEAEGWRIIRKRITTGSQAHCMSYRLGIPQRKRK